MSQNAKIEVLIEAVLPKFLPQYESLIAVRKLSAGASQDTFKIDIRADGKDITIALRRSPIKVKEGPSLDGIGLPSEAKLFRLAAQHNIPSPEILYELTPEDELGSGYFMPWITGETMGHKILRSPALAEIRPHLAKQCGEVIARIHGIDWQKEGLDQFLEVRDTASMIDKIWKSYVALNVPCPMIDFTRRWLLENKPTERPKVLVHNDFRNGNLIVDEAGIQAVLDWELAHIGDPVQDLGWLCVNSWRFGNADLPVGGFGHVKDLLDAYASVTGEQVPESDLVYWMVYGSFQWSVMTLVMASTWRTGETPSLERPVIGRRSSEAQMDCVNLLIPGPFTLPELKEDLSLGTQLPMPAELLSGVMVFLSTTVSEKMPAPENFLAKVAANSLGIAQRELLYGQALSENEAQRISALLPQNSNEAFDVDTLRWKLIEALRAELPLNTVGLAEHLRETTAGQLFIDQPRYSALNSA